MSRLKLTGFGRFFIFLLILGPIAYFGIQYLNNSGALDKMKEKVEDIQEERAEEPRAETGEDILKEINKESTSAQDAVIAEQQRKIEELQRQNQQLQKENQQSTTSTVPDIFKEEPTASPQIENNNGAPSLNDLVREAENNMREKGNSPGTGSTIDNSPNLGGTRKSLATWAFSFSGTNGTIELFQQGDQLISRTVYQGRSRVDVQELIERNDRLYVRDSPTNEYYTLRSNGDLDAYDNSGFLTTCIRQ